MSRTALSDFWQERFTEMFLVVSGSFRKERTRLLASLGELTDGGIVEALQPIGSVSFETGAKATEADAQTRLDIGLAVWPFPPEARELAALQTLGYAPVPGYEAAPEWRSQHQRASVPTADCGCGQ